MQKSDGMLFDEETRYWQEQYRQGKIPKKDLDDCCGETLAILDGSAEKMFKYAMIIFAVILLLLFLTVPTCIGDSNEGSYDNSSRIHKQV
jgi:hypothetical protein